MTSGTKAVKLTAKTALKNKMLKSVIVSSAVLFAFFICFYSASLFELAAGPVAAIILFAAESIFMLSPLLLGTVRYFWRLLFDADDSPISVFYYFSEKELYLKALRLILNLLARIAGAAVLAFIPTVAVWLVSQSFVYEAFDATIPIWTANLNGILIFLRTVAVIAVTAVALKYYSAPVLFVADDEIEVGEAVYMAKTISRRTYIDFVFLCFSFIGWIFLSFLVIPLVFLLPYFAVSYAVHVRFAVADYNLFVEKHNQNNVYNSFGGFENEL